jgi:hypothetical protein
LHVACSEALKRLQRRGAGAVDDTMTTARGEVDEATKRQTNKRGSALDVENSRRKDEGGAQRDVFIYLHEMAQGIA